MIFFPTSKAVPGKSGLIIMARVEGVNRQPITQATLSSITYTITDVTTALAIATAQTIAISTSVFDNLQQNDPTWNGDSQLNPTPEDGLWGYNFKWTVPATSLVPAGDRFQIDVVFTPTSGQQFVLSMSVPTIKNYV